MKKMFHCGRRLSIIGFKKNGRGKQFCLSWWDGSASTGACYKAGWPEFETQVPHGGMGEVDVGE